MAATIMETKETISNVSSNSDDGKHAHGVGDGVDLVGFRRPTHTGTWSYVNKAIMAPMVRISTLPMRLLAYHYGADICYSEEMIDRKIAKCIRRVDPVSGRIEFHLPSGGLAFATYENEPVVMQLGTADPVLALQAAKVVEKDVRAIDINMGCPKHFSLQGGMGAALLSQPELVHNILSTLTRNLSIPVTCKIRLLENQDDTMRLIKAAESAGVAAIAIHARHIRDRPRNPARVSMVPAVIAQMTVPAIYNGDVFYHDDIARMKKDTGATSAMIARGAQWNASVFRSAGMLPVYEVCRDYIKIAESVGNVFANTKYACMEMLKGHVGPVPSYQNVCNSRSFDQLLNNITIVSKASPLITCAYAAPLDASLQAEADRRKQSSSSSSDAKLYAEAATGAAAATTTTTTTSSSNDTTKGGSGGPRKRRRQRQKEKRARRLHSKYLRASTTTEVATGNTNTSSTPTPTPTTRDIHASAEATNPTDPVINALTTPSPSTSPSVETSNLIAVAT